VAQWVRSLDLASLLPIQHGFAPGFVNNKKGCTRLAVDLKTKMGICCLSVQHVDRLVGNLDNVSWVEWLFMWASTKKPTKHVGLVQSGYHLIECKLFSPWYIKCTHTKKLSTPMFFWNDVIQQVSRDWNSRQRLLFYTRRRRRLLTRSHERNAYMVTCWDITLAIRNYKKNVNLVNI
jgi:hypothetical protein